MNKKRTLIACASMVPFAVVISVFPAGGSIEWAAAALITFLVAVAGLFAANFL